MKVSSRLFAQLGLAAAFVVLSGSITALLVVPRYSAPVAVADVGTLAPDFQLNDSIGRSVALSDFPGQFIVMFFRSDSTSTLSQARADRLAGYFATDDRVKFLTIDVVARNADEIQTSDSSINPDVPTLKDINGIVATRYSAKTPAIIIVGPHRQVCYRGELSPANPGVSDARLALFDECENALKNVLASSTVAVASNMGHGQ